MKNTLAMVAMAVFLSGIAAVRAATQFEFDGAHDYETGEYGYYYTVTAGLFPNRTGSPPVPNGDRASGTGVIMHIKDDPNGRPPGRWFQDWDAGPIDGWFEDTSGIALTLSNNATVVYDNHGIDSGTHPADYYGDGNGGISYSMVNNYDEITSGYFFLDASTTFDSLSGYFIGYGGFDANSPSVGLHVNIFTASVSDADPLPDPPLTYSPTVNSFTGDVLSSHKGASSFAAGVMSATDSGLDIDVFGGTYDIFRATYTLDDPITLDSGHYYFGHHAVVAVPEPSTGILVALVMAKAALRRNRNCSG